MPVHVYANPKDSAAMMNASQLNNQANILESHGDFVGAEKLFLESLRLKIECTGEDSIQAALSKNALGELYMKLDGRWEDAKKMLEDADRVRSGFDDFDAACTRDNLGQLWEIKGDMVKARMAREKLPDSMICSNFSCPLSTANVKSKRRDLKNCGRCKCVWYCSVECQKFDWRSRHKKWCKAPEVKSAEQLNASN
ncbi:hypothetical protein EYC80_007155 [Monilinia laxa]|uniref:MYND-type domain-containing protein n=1 Tax=Monilinia laxa TaxID=61186 RepID=A0A5N6K0D4_MONLA|nr:hypothetical protein EYC80_007155 [Monilinia laxa]